MKTLFLKSNVPHIRLNEGEYVVSNPELFVYPKTFDEFTDLRDCEWPYGVELVDACPDKGNLLVCANESCWDLEECQHRKVARLIPEEKKTLDELRDSAIKGLTEIRDKIQNHLGDSFTESAYKEFEDLAAKQRDIEPEIAEVLAKHGHELFESSEPQEKWEWFKCQSCDGSGRVHRDSLSIVDVSAPSESQEELWVEVISEARFYDGSPHDLKSMTNYMRKRFTITRNP